MSLICGYYVYYFILFYELSKLVINYDVFITITNYYDDVVICYAICTQMLYYANISNCW